MKIALWYGRKGGMEAGRKKGKKEGGKEGKQGGREKERKEFVLSCVEQSTRLLAC